MLPHVGSSRPALAAHGSGAVVCPSPRPRPRRRRRSATNCTARRLLALPPLLALVASLSVLLHRASCFAVGGRPGGKIPITVLSGFLGSGKTTLLKHLLENGEGLKIAVIVNDVASVNIDSRLVAGTTSLPSSGGSGNGGGRPDAIVQLSNGCACCSLSDELLASVSELVTLSDLRADEDKFDHIVVELSGVSEPRAVRGNFQDAVFYGMPLMDRVRLDTMVTVVDCGTYLRHLRSGAEAAPGEAPELFYRNEEERLEAERAKEEEEDWYSGLPDKLREALQAGDDSDSMSAEVPSGGGPGAGAGVSDLLVEQTEIADVLLLNKVDILREDGRDAELGNIESIVASLNPRARVLRTEFGIVKSLGDVLGVAGGRGVAEAGIVDDHRDFVEAAEKNRDAAEQCADPDCDDPTHSHSRDHDHSGEGSAAAATESADPDRTDPSHSQSHSHSHSHSHSRGGDGDSEETTCTDPDCTDPSHSHSHSHSHASSSFGGIGTYVYRARRPFHPRRLASFLRHLPVTRGLPPREEDGEGQEVYDLPDGARKALSRVLRSKGFAWTADSDVAALYWSHAGSSFEMQCLGRWWATLPRDQWPREARETILAEFDHSDAFHKEARAAEEEDGAVVGLTSTSSSVAAVGDRRQEIVFIGPGVADRGDGGGGNIIREALDRCLLTDEEWDRYLSSCSDEGRLRDMFAGPIRSRMISY